MFHQTTSNSNLLQLLKHAKNSDLIKNFSLAQSTRNLLFHTFTPRKEHQLRHLRLGKRSFQAYSITQVLGTKEWLITLNSEGIALFINKESGHTVLLNTGKEENYKFLYYDREKEKILCILSYKEDSANFIIAKSYDIKDLVEEKVRCKILFGEYKMESPDFIEVDTENSLIITKHSSEGNKLRIWTLSTYSLIWVIEDQSICEFKISLGFLLLIGEVNQTFLPLAVLDLHTGKISLQINIQNSGKLELLEVLGNTIIIKEKGEILKLFDVFQNKLIKIDREIFGEAIIFMHRQHRFISINDSHLFLYNSNCEIINTFPNSKVRDGKPCEKYIIHIAERENLVFNYVNKDSQGYIQIICLQTKEVIGKIDPRNTIFAKIPKLLNHLTSMYYEEESKVLYTTHRNGMIYEWTIQTLLIARRNRDNFAMDI